MLRPAAVRLIALRLNAGSAEIADRGCLDDRALAD
jgi:hypothetical protein